MLSLLAVMTCIAHGQECLLEQGRPHYNPVCAVVTTGVKTLNAAFPGVKANPVNNKPYVQVHTAQASTVCLGVQANEANATPSQLHRLKRQRQTAEGDAERGAGASVPQQADEEDGAVEKSPEEGGSLSTEGEESAGPCSTPGCHATDFTCWQPCWSACKYSLLLLLFPAV